MDNYLETHLPRIDRIRYVSNHAEDESSAGVPVTKEDVKFIWNGRVLSSAEDLIDACQDYFSTTPAGEYGRVLTLHAVVRPPKPPVKRKGKKKGEARQSSQSTSSDTLGGVDCSCCVIM